LNQLEIETSPEGRKGSGEEGKNSQKREKKDEIKLMIGDRIDVLSLSKPMELLIEARATEQSEVTKVFSVQLDRSSVPGSLSNFYNHQAVPS